MSAMRDLDAADAVTLRDSFLIGLAFFAVVFVVMLLLQWFVIGVLLCSCSVLKSKCSALSPFTSFPDS
jgi:flagellar biosynthesis protein FlhB